MLALSWLLNSDYIWLHTVWERHRCPVDPGILFCYFEETGQTLILQWYLSRIVNHVCSTELLFIFHTAIPADTKSIDLLGSWKHHQIPNPWVESTDPKESMELEEGVAYLPATETAIDNRLWMEQGNSICQSCSLWISESMYSKSMSRKNLLTTFPPRSTESCAGLALPWGQQKRSSQAAGWNGFPLLSISTDPPLPTPWIGKGREREVEWKSGQEESGGIDFVFLNLVIIFNG